VLPSEADTTKLALEGMVHQPGPLSTGELTLIHVPTAQEIKIEASSLSVTAPAAQQQTEAPWTLPTVAIGGWNYTLIGILALIFLALLTAGALRLYRRFVKKHQKNHKEKAISALNGLQKYARSRKGLQQEEWKRFSFELAGILRRFSDENFHIDTSDMTDREFLAELRLQPRARSQVDSLAGLLSMIDEVRYGKKHLEVTLVPGLLLEAKKFVETTFRPEEETRS
jgi:hypothetical protein